MCHVFHRQWRSNDHNRHHNQNETSVKRDRWHESDRNNFEKEKSERDRKDNHRGGDNRKKRSGKDRRSSSREIKRHDSKDSGLSHGSSQTLIEEVIDRLPQLHVQDNVAVWNNGNTVSESNSSTIAPKVECIVTEQLTKTDRDILVCLG